MKKFVCMVCDYVHEGEADRRNVRYVTLRLISSKSRMLRWHGLLSML